MNQSALIVFESSFGQYTLVVKTGANMERIAKVLKDVYDSFTNSGDNYYGAGEAATRALICLRTSGIPVVLGVNNANGRVGFVADHVITVRNNGHRNITVSYSKSGSTSIQITTFAKLAEAVKSGVDYNSLTGKLVRFFYEGGSETGTRVVSVTAVEGGLLKGRDLSKSENDNFRQYKVGLIKQLEVVKV